MARPKKQTVDYFPHTCTHKKTMFIIEQKYGNDGYAFWFKMLEMLGSSEGHYLKLENNIDWEFLIANTRLDKDKCTEILNLLATLGAIDKDLWNECKIVWSDNFIEGIKDVYRFRVMEIPTKPDIPRGKQPDEEVKHVNNTLEIPKVKYSKVNKSKVKNINNIDELTFNFSTFKFENLLKTDIEDWKILYDKVNIEKELLKMVEWLKIHQGEKRAHKKLWRKFISNWLKGNQEALTSGIKNKELIEKMIKGIGSKTEILEDPGLIESAKNCYIEMGKKCNVAYGKKLNAKCIICLQKRGSF